MKENTWKCIAVISFFFTATVIWVSCVYTNLLDFLLAVWTIFFIIVLTGCVFVVMSILLYDFMIHK